MQKNSNKEQWLHKQLWFYIFFSTNVFTVLSVLKEINSVQTLLFCAGGQSSSLTPNVTPAGGFFSKGFLISPGMPFLHVPLSLGGLVSSACTVKQRKLLNAWFFLMNAKKGVVCFSYLCACSSSPAPVWVSVDLFLWSLLSLPAACAWCSATGVKVWATAPSCCLSGWMRRGRETQNEFSNQSSPVQLCVSNPPPSFTLTSSRCCTPWSSCWWGHGWWRPRSKKRKKKEGRKQKETIGDG